MSIVLMTLFHSNYQPLADVVFPNWKEYCDRHGYDLQAFCMEEGDRASVGFQKTVFVHDQLFVKENKWDAALVLDLDILITNLTPKVESFMDDVHDCFMTTGFNGLCAGSYIIKKSAGGRQVLEYVLSNKYSHLNEQDTIKYHLDEPVLKDKIKLFPYSTLGSFKLDFYPEHKDIPREGANWEPGHFLLHLAAMSLAQRLSIFQSAEIQGAIVR